MKKITYIIVVLLLSFIIIGCEEDELVPYQEIGILSGKVVEAENFNPIPNAKVSLNPSNNSVFTDEEGNYEFLDVGVGDYSVKAEKEDFLAGYEAVTVEANKTANLVFELDVSDALNRPPSAPLLISPENNSTGHPLEVAFIWSESEDENEDDDLIYGLHIINDLDDTVIDVESIIDTTYTVSGLQYGAKYFWQIRVNDGHNDDVLTTVNSFETTSITDARHFFVKEMSGHDMIYSYNEDEVLLQLTSTSDNCWRPRSNQASDLIAFLKTVDTETHIFTMDLDGSNVQQVTAAAPLLAFKQSEIDYAWSSNGDRFLYPSFDKLYLINKDGSGNTLIYQTLDGSLITECDWSYDESLIALKTNDINGYAVSIFIIDMDGNLLNTVLSGVSGAAGGLNLSVDNQRLLYTRDTSGFEDTSYRQLNTHMFIYNFSTTELTDVSSDKEAGTNDLDPRFSPDESQVIFVNTSNDGISEKKIYTMTLAELDRVMLFEDSFMPDWE